MTVFLSCVSQMERNSFDVTLSIKQGLKIMASPWDSADLCDL